MVAHTALEPDVAPDVVYTQPPCCCGVAPRIMASILEGLLQLAIPRRSLGSGLFYLYQF